MKTGALIVLIPLSLLAEYRARAEASAAGPKEARINFNSAVYDFGKIPTGEAVKHDFIFTNTGNAALEVTDVHPGCGCTTAGNWDRLVEPGKTGKIPLQFNSAGFGGLVEKSATVTCNDPQNPSPLLVLKGAVWTPVEVSPSMAVFNVASDAAGTETKTLRIQNNTQSVLALSELQCTNQQIAVSLRPLEPGKIFELTVTVKPPFQPGTHIIPITAKTSLKEAPVLSMTAYLIVKQPVTVGPSQLVLSAKSSEIGGAHTFFVRNQTSSRLRLANPTVNIPGARVEIVETEPGKAANLTVVLPTGIQLKPGGHYEITASTGIDSSPRLVIPVISANTAGEAPAPAVAPAAVVPRARTVPSRSALTGPAGK